jgi:hypothetical protein
MSHSQKRQLSNFLLNARYQVSFTLPAVVLSMALFVSLGYLADRHVESATTVGLNQIEVAGAAYLEEPSHMRQALLERAHAIRCGIVVGGVLLSLGLALFGVVLSHRVAGPLHRIDVELRRLKDGSFAPVPDIRRRDWLAGFYERFRLACMALRSREEQQIARWKAALVAAEHDSSLRDLVEVERMRTRLQIKEKSLG